MHVRTGILACLVSMMFLFYCCFGTTQAIGESQSKVDIIWSDVLKEHKGYVYDKFEKNWSYYGGCYKQYSDAYFVMGIQLLGEQGSETEIREIVLYSWLRDQSNQRLLNPIKNLQILIGNQVFTCQMLINEDRRESITSILPTEAGRKLLLALMSADQISIRLKFVDRNSIDIDFEKDELTGLNEVAYNIIKYNAMKCFSSTEWMEYCEENYPIQVTE